jgi:hypothetical protein
MQVDLCIGFVAILSLCACGVSAPPDPPTIEWAQRWPSPPASPPAEWTQVTETLPFPGAPCDEEFRSELNRRLATRQLQDTELRYEWTGGYGRGDVHLIVRQGSPSVLELHEKKKAVVSLKAAVSPDRFLQLLSVARAVDFACAAAAHRETCLTDVGRTSITIRLGREVREVWWDGTSYVEQCPDIGRMHEAVLSLSDVFGRKFDWGPFGTTPYPCNDERGKPAG